MSWRKLAEAIGLGIYSLFIYKSPLFGLGQGWKGYGHEEPLPKQFPAIRHFLVCQLCLRTMLCKGSEPFGRATP